MANESLIATHPVHGKSVSSIITGSLWNPMFKQSVNRKGTEVNQERLQLRDSGIGRALDVRLPTADIGMSFFSKNKTNGVLK